MSLTVVEEPWSRFWPDADALASKHFVEVDGGIEPRRPYRVDATIMETMNGAGCLRLFSARLDGAMVGYLTWNVTPDVESAGLLIAQQGAWFVCPGFERHRIGWRLFKFSIAALRAMGVQNIFPHHRLQGRGAHLGRFFRSLGAKEIQHTYSLWIGD